MDHTSRNSGMLAHQSRRNHDLSPLRGIRPGSYNRLAPAAGAATVLAIAGLGILLAFTGPRNPARKSAPEFDQENALFHGSRTPSHSPWSTPVSGPSPRASDPSPGASGSSPGASDPSPRPTARTSSAAVRRSPDSSTPGVPELSARGPSTAAPGWVRVLPAPTRKAGSPRPSTLATAATARAATPAARTSPAATPAPEPPAPEPRAPEPRATVPAESNPCATFQDLRQTYCYQLLDSLTR